MNIFNHQKQLLFLITLPILISIACNIPFLQIPAPQETQIISISTQPIEEKLVIIEETKEPTEAFEPFHLVVTEAQLTSIINYELQSYQEYKIEDVKVYLRDGKVKITGNAEQNNLLLPLTIEVRFDINENGLPEYEITTANIGLFELPDFLVDQMYSVIDKALNSSILPSANNVYINSLTIDDGQATITGYTK